MKNTDIREFTDDELVAAIKDTRTELFNLRFQMATGQLENTGRVVAVKKDIARLLTESRARESRAERDSVSS